MIEYPQALKVHKKSAELQFQLAKPKKVDEGGRSVNKLGCVFLEVAKAKEDGSDRMDWENKITIAQQVLWGSFNSNWPTKRCCKNRFLVHTRDLKKSRFFGAIDMNRPFSEPFVILGPVLGRITS